VRPTGALPFGSGTTHGRVHGVSGEACEGRGDGTDCPNGEVLDVEAGGRSPVRGVPAPLGVGRDGTEPERRVVEDEGPTRPSDAPGEAGHGSAAQSGPSRPCAPGTAVGQWSE
jgi:hypothetical protein